MHRFLVTQNNLQVGKTIDLPATEAKHIYKSLRLTKGEPIVLFNNQITATAELDLVSKSRVSARILSVTETATHGPQIHIYVGILKNLNLVELILQKCTELQATSIHLIETEYTQNQIWVLAERKAPRLQKILQEAAKQAELNWLPELHIKQQLNEILTQAAPQSQRLFCTLPRQLPATEIINIHDYLVKHSQTKADEWHIVIGPEGGFSAAEHSLAKQHNWQFVDLGKDLVLRTETAAILATGIVSSYLRQD
jgi:16S rRNA (uracil1498-N3)-methyltransferase